MASPLNVNRNDYRNNPKRNDIVTSLEVAHCLFDIISEHIKISAVNSKFPKVILDPAVGTGNLLAPWKQFSVNFNLDIKTIGIDIENYNDCVDDFLQTKFEDITYWNFKMPDLILCNPPFNQGVGRKLYSYVFLQKIIELFKNTVPVVLFCPMGFRLNQRKHSNRWKWLRNNKVEISSILSLPLDMFNNVEFHNEILFINFPEWYGLKPHYFMSEKYL